MTTLPTDLETVGRLMLAAVLGLAIGLERESAGLRIGHRLAHRRAVSNAEGARQR